REAELARLAQCYRNNAVLERQRREVDRIVLDPELLDAQRLGEAVCLDQRRAADVQADGRLALQRQQFAVAPHVVGPALEERAADLGPEGIVVLEDLDRAQVFRT